MDSPLPVGRDIRLLRIKEELELLRVQSMGHHLLCKLLDAEIVKLEAEFIALSK